MKPCSLGGLFGSAQQHRVGRPAYGGRPSGRDATSVQARRIINGQAGNENSGLHSPQCLVLFTLTPYYPSEKTKSKCQEFSMEGTQAKTMVVKELVNKLAHGDTFF